MQFDAMVDALERGRRRKIRRIPLTPGMFRGIGRVADVIGRWTPVSAGLSGEAAQLLTAAIPTDDQVTLDDLKMSWRSPAEAIEASVG